MDLSLNYVREGPHSAPAGVFSIQNFTGLDGSARRTFVHAASYALDRNHEYVGTEHVLMGLLEEGSIVQIIERLKGDHEVMRREIDKLSSDGPTPIDPATLLLTPRVAKVVEYAREELQDSRTGVDAYDLLIGTMRERDGLAGQALRYGGLHWNQIDHIRDVVRTSRELMTF